MKTKDQKMREAVADSHLPHWIIGQHVSVERKTVIFGKWTRKELATILISLRKSGQNSLARRVSKKSGPYLEIKEIGPR